MQALGQQTADFFVGGELFGSGFKSRDIYHFIFIILANVNSR